MQNLLEMRNISKDFAGVLALNNISLTLQAGEIVSLCGENGSGKSTLMKVLSGIWSYGSYTGEILLEGKPQRFKTIKDSEKTGIVIINQELALVGHLSVAENIFLGVEKSHYGFINQEEMSQEAAKLLKLVKLNISPETKLGDLGVGQQQLVEIARALGKNAKILVLDEPSSSLTESETNILLGIVKDLKAQGVACVYISHKLDEVMQISDRIMIIRDGEHIGTEKITDMTKDKIISMMVGRELSNLFPREEHDIGEVIFEAKNFTVYDTTMPHIKRVDNASFSLRKGEILGFSGLVGAGRSELMLAIYGAWNGKYQGKIFLEGYEIKINSAQQALANKIALVPEDRKVQGIIGIHSVGLNMTLANLDAYANQTGVVDFSKEAITILESMKRLKVKAARTDMAIQGLSGGNQQKVILAKVILTQPKVLILDEPTRGIDVGAKYEIYKLIFELAKLGYSIILVSSELPEVLGISDRVIVMNQGKITGDFINNQQLTQEDILQNALGDSAHVSQ